MGGQPAFLMLGAATATSYEADKRDLTGISYVYSMPCVVQFRGKGYL